LALKQEILEYSTEISLSIEDDFSQAERRKYDMKMVLDSFNNELKKLKEIVEKEELIEFQDYSSSTLQNSPDKFK
jgi:hypothetical protein